MKLSLLNLVLAGLWLVVAGGVFTWQALTGDARLTFRLGESPVSLGWLAVFLSGYNLLRWWVQRSARVRRGLLQEMEARRPSARRPDRPPASEADSLFTKPPRSERERPSEGQ
jgi:hypothetical protein